jgi:amino acid transporter
VAAVIGMFAGTHIGTVLQAQVVPICLIAILGLTIANLRGLKEAGLLFALPTYAFILSIIATVIAGLYALWTHAPYAHAAAQVGHANAIQGAQSGLQAVGLILILQAFSQGCSALTGMEAISSTVPIFQKPQAKNAVTAMYWMSGLAVVMFFGITYVSNAFGATWMDASKPGYQSVIGQVAKTVWPPALHWMFYVVQISTAIILVIAANTAYAGFPQLASMMARDNFLPRQLANVGDRLAFNNGILLLTLVACALIIIFQGLVDALLPMYAIGVFIGFTLAQTGMVRRWLRLRTKNWQISLTFNALGAVATGLVVLIIAVSKFDNGNVIVPGIHLFGRYQPHYGVWIVLMIVPILVLLFLKIHRHYTVLTRELSLDAQRPKLPSRNVVLVLVPRLHRGVVNALNYARLISDDARAVYIETDPVRTAELKQDWQEYGEDIPLVIMESPFRSLIGPLMRYIDTVQKERTDDVVTVVLPELVSRKWWHRLLHNQYASLLRLAISSRRDVVLTNVRYFLEG